MVGRIDEALRDDLEMAMIAAVKQDSVAIADIVARMGEVPADIDEPALRESIQDFLDEYTHQSLDEFDLSGCLIRGISIPGFLGCVASITMGWSIVRAINRSNG